MPRARRSARDGRATSPRGISARQASAERFHEAASSSRRTFCGRPLKTCQEVFYVRQEYFSQSFAKRALGPDLVSSGHMRGARGEARRGEALQFSTAGAIMSRHTLRRLPGIREHLGDPSRSPLRMKSAKSSMQLVWPARDYLPWYISALEGGWSPDSLRGEAAAREQLTRIAEDADAFVASLIDREAAGEPIALPDGPAVPRLPRYHRWMWDGDFCGSIGFAGSPGPKRFLPIALDTSAIQWCPGSGGAGTRRSHWAPCCGTQKLKGFGMSRSRQHPRTQRRSA